LLSGITVLREGFVPLSVEEHRDKLLAIRRGGIAWDEVNAWRLELHKCFNQVQCFDPSADKRRIRVLQFGF